MNTQSCQDTAEENEKYDRSSRRHSIDGARKGWIDQVRGLCILLVIAYHSEVITENLGFAVPAFLVPINAALEPFRMPLLMFLSGLVTIRSLRKPAKTYFRGKLTKIYWPFLVWSILQLLLTADYLSLYNLLRIPFVNPTFLWYLQFLFTYYLITYAIHKYRISPIPLVFACIIASQFLPEDFRIARFAYLFAFFLLGYASINIRPSFANIAPLVAIFSTGAYASVVGLEVRYAALFAWAPIALCLVVNSLGNRFFSASRETWLQDVGKQSIVYYVSHLIVIENVRRILPEQIHAFVAYSIIIAASLLVAATLQKARTTYPVVNMLFDFEEVIKRTRMKRTMTPLPPLSRDGSGSR